MWIVVDLLFAAAFALVGLHLVRTWAPAAPARNVRHPAPRRAAPAARAPEMKPLAWEPQPASRPALAGSALTQRMRDRYIAARFPGVAAACQDLLDADRVIRAARLYFEERADDLAFELLKMAIDQSPRSEALRLAQLEIAYLRRSRGRYVSLARSLRNVMPESPNWAEVCRLGRALAPDEGLFAGAKPSGSHAHYGPWPDVPNWIRASWDFTPEALAVEFRRALLRGRSEPAARQQIRIGA
ncbi:MAG TPA: hypothetical protein VFV90_12085 [Usitatibacter sp.]|nr:hypothetical protein [Usitatibacter sp.]